MMHPPRAREATRPRPGASVTHCSTQNPPKAFIIPLSLFLATLLPILRPFDTYFPSDPPAVSAIGPPYESFNGFNISFICQHDASCMDYLF